MATLGNAGRELRFAGASIVRAVRPLNDDLLIGLEPDLAREGGLVVVPEGAADTRRARTGRVVATGPGRPLTGGGRRPPCVHPGDRVIVPARAGRGLRLRIDGREHVLVSERDVLAVVDPT